MMNAAQEFNQWMRQRIEDDQAARKRDGDYLHGQIVGASFVLDQIGAPRWSERGSLSVSQRIEAYLARRADLLKKSATLPPCGINATEPPAV